MLLVSYSIIDSIRSMLAIMLLAVVADALDGAYTFPSSLCIRRRH